MDATETPETPEEFEVKTAEPAAGGSNVTHNGTEYNAVREGQAVILRPAQESSTQTVFYNPIQQFNRDLSVLAIRAYGEHVLALKKQRALRKREKGTKRKREDDVEAEDAKQARQEAPTKRKRDTSHVPRVERRKMRRAVRRERRELERKTSA